MVLHLGHLVHNPSGISFFLDLPVSFGFFAKVVLPLVAECGVTAGADVSSPSVFFVKEVVAIFRVPNAARGLIAALPRCATMQHCCRVRTFPVISKYALVEHYSNSTSQCPDANLTRAGAA